MSSPFIITAIRDVAPTLSEPYPQELKRMINNIYNSSKQKINLKQSEEIARYHICAIVAINRLKSEHGFLDPVLDNSPIPTKSVVQLLNLFEANLQIKSSASTPISTPQKKRIIGNETNPSPSGAKGAPSSAKKLKLTDKLDLIAAESQSSPETTPLNSPTKVKTPKSHNNLLKTPSKSSPLKRSIGGSGYASPSKHLKLLSASEITALCNKFQLEQDVVSNVLDTFRQYFNKVSNEWVLLSGLIINCYFVINHQVINEKVGSRANVIKTMFSLQNGGLMLDDVNKSVTIVHGLISHNKWFKQLKLKFDFPLDEGTIASTSGNMISKDVQFNSKESQALQELWINKIKHEIQLRRSSEAIK